MRKLSSSCIVATATTALVLAGCATNIPPVTPQMAATASQPFSVLEHGRQLYGGACSACHAPYPVGKYSSSQWHELVADMGERAKLSSPDSNAVLAYVLAARAASPPTQQ